ncbi:MAG: hypothetical protein K8R64_06670 [Methanosarcinaceae archaeon]|nr:hypothetical protein [Methanosarcinaceae archaeon]
MNLTKTLILAVVLLLVSYSLIGLLPPKVIEGNSIERISDLELTFAGTSRYAEITFDNADILRVDWDEKNKLSGALFVKDDTILIDKSLTDIDDKAYYELTVGALFEIKDDITLTILQEGKGYTTLTIQDVGTYTNQDSSPMSKIPPVSFLIPATKFAENILNTTSVFLLGLFSMIIASLLAIVREKRWTGISSSKDNDRGVNPLSTLISIVFGSPLLKRYWNLPISSQSIIFALIMLVITPFFLIYDREDLAEQSAIYAYFLLVLGVGSRLISEGLGEDRMNTIEFNYPMAIEHLKYIPLGCALFSVIGLAGMHIVVPDMAYVLWYWLILLSIFLIPEYGAGVEPYA